MQDTRQIVNVPHQPVVLGAGPGDADSVAFLEGIVADEMGGHLAGDADKGNGVEHCIRQRRHHVGRARAGRNEGDARLAGGAGIAFGRMAGALLVAHQDMLKSFLLNDLIIDGKHCTARVAEDRINSLVFQRLYDHFGAGHFPCHSSCPCFTRPGLRAVARLCLFSSCCPAATKTRGREVLSGGGYKKRPLGEPWSRAILSERGYPAAEARFPTTTRMSDIGMSSRSFDTAGRQRPSPDMTEKAILFRDRPVNPVISARS